MAFDANLISRQDDSTTETHQNVKVFEESFDDGVEGVAGEVGDEGVRQVEREPQLVAHGHAEVPCFHCHLC